MENEDNSQAVQMKKIRTNMSEESRVPFEENPKIDFVSTKLCLFDKTWPCRSVDYVPWPQWNTTKTGIDEKTESSIKILTSKSQKPRNDFVSTELCLFDKSWPCRKSNYYTEQTRKMELEDNMEQEQIGSNDFVTLAPRNKESMEQTRKMEDDMDSKQHQMVLSIKKMILIKHKHKHDICSMSKTYFDANILRYLSEDDQKKIKLGYGIKVNTYDDELQTTHKEVLIIKFWSLKQMYLLIGTWLRRRSLQVGDKIRLFWDCSRYMLHFRVRSRATAQVITSTAEVISG